MNYTQNYQLCLWDEDDRILMEDFNSDNEKLETALSQLPQKGNCQIYYTSYWGNRNHGSTEPSSLEFPKLPVLLLIFTSDAWFISFPRHSLGMAFDSAGTHLNACSYQGSTVSWYTFDDDPAHQMNDLREYTVVALLDAEEE